MEVIIRTIEEAKRCGRRVLRRGWPKRSGDGENPERLPKEKPFQVQTERRLASRGGAGAVRDHPPGLD